MGERKAWVKVGERGGSSVSSGPEALWGWGLPGRSGDWDRSRSRGKGLKVRLLQISIAVGCVCVVGGWGVRGRRQRLGTDSTIY